VLSDRISYLRAGGFENAGKIDRTAIVLPGRAPQTFNRGGGLRKVIDVLREDRWETAAGEVQAGEERE